MKRLTATLVLLVSLWAILAWLNTSWLFVLIFAVPFCLAGTGLMVLRREAAGRVV